MHYKNITDIANNGTPTQYSKSTIAVNKWSRMNQSYFFTAGNQIKKKNKSEKTLVRTCPFLAFVHKVTLLKL